jgi:hypothetical protein
MQGKRVAVHARVLNVPKNRGRHTTITEHMPKATQARRCCFGVKKRIKDTAIGVRKDY